MLHCYLISSCPLSFCYHCCRATFSNAWKDDCYVFCPSLFKKCLNRRRCLRYHPCAFLYACSRIPCPSTGFGILFVSRPSATRPIDEHSGAIAYTDGSQWTVKFRWYGCCSKRGRRPSVFLIPDSFLDARPWCASFLIPPISSINQKSIIMKEKTASCAKPTRYPQNYPQLSALFHNKTVEKCKNSFFR